MNKIHSTVIIEGEVELGDHNEILPYTVLIGPLKIGNGNWIGPHVVIGTPGEDTKNPRYDASLSLITIGNNNIIRENSVIQKPCYRDITLIGNQTYIMNGAYIPHDAVLKDKVVIASNVSIGGISLLLDGCNIGMGATLHQHSVIGHYSIVATNAAVIKNVKPFSRFIPGKQISVNTYAVSKFGFEEYLAEIEAYVIEDKRPISNCIVDIISEFEDLHNKSGRAIY